MSVWRSQVVKPAPRNSCQPVAAHNSDDMAFEQQPLQAVLDSIRSVCAETQTAVIRGTLSHGDSAPTIGLEPAELLSAIQAEKPAAVFYSLIAFDPDDFIDLALRANDWREGYEKRPGSRFPTPEKVRAYVQPQIDSLELRSIAHHELHVCYSRDGCLRTMTVSEDWAEEFYGAVADFVEAYIRDAEIDNDEAEERAKATMADMIKKVSQDEGFRAIRGLPKRLLYLQKHYGSQIPPHPRGRLSRPAQHVELVDLHVATVLIEASNLIWAEANL